MLLMLLQLLLKQLTSNIPSQAEEDCWTKSLIDGEFLFTTVAARRLPKESKLLCIGGGP